MEMAGNDSLILINFKAPESLKNTFDMLCKYESRTRTSALLALMDSYISDRGGNIRLGDSSPDLMTNTVKPAGKSSRSIFRALIPEKLRSAFKRPENSIEGVSTVGGEQ